MSKHIFWISSYPKSGNTLLRSILSSLFFTIDGNFKFDLLKKIVTFEEISRLKYLGDIGSNIRDLKNKNDKINLIYKNIDLLQKKEFLGFSEDFAFFKTHFSAEYKDENFVLEKNTRGVIYVVRDPRDVCISWSKHSGLKYDDSIEFLLNNDSIIKWTDVDSQNYYPENTPVYLSRWDNHVVSWSKISKNIPILTIRFEDLVYEKERTILKIIEFFEKNYNLQIPNKEKKIYNILKTTDFLYLQDKEVESGFNESVNKQFFSVGKKEQWKYKLDKKQNNKIEQNFKKVMKLFNYDLGVDI